VSFINVLNAVAHGSAPLEICARIRRTSDTVCQPAGCESAVPRLLVVAPVASAAAAKLTTINATGHIIVHNRATASTDAARRGKRTAARWACTLEANSVSDRSSVAMFLCVWTTARSRVLERICTTLNCQRFQTSDSHTHTRKLAKLSKQSPHAGGQCCRGAWGNDGGLRGLSRTTRHDLQNRGVGECWLRGGVGFLTVHTHSPLLSFTLHGLYCTVSCFVPMHTCMHGGVCRRPGAPYILRLLSPYKWGRLWERTDLFAFVWATLFGMPRHLNVTEANSRKRCTQTLTTPATHHPDDHASHTRSHAPLAHPTSLRLRHHCSHRRCAASLHSRYLW
jgi:hypothetical protein